MWGLDLCWHASLFCGCCATERRRSMHILTFFKAGTLANSDNRMLVAPVDTSRRVSNAVPL